MQRVKKLTNGKIQIITNGGISISMQCNISYRVTGQTRLDIMDTANQKASLFSDQLTYTELEPAAAIAQSFASAQEMADYLDANFFAG